VCLLYLIRHGATDNNEANPPKLQGRRTDPGLSAKGRDQAMRAAQWLASQGISAVYASPLLRARQTAEPIAKLAGVSVELRDDITEIDVGEWEELAWEEIERRNPVEYRLFMTDASQHPYLGGENLSTVQHRAIPAMASLMAANLGRRIAVVSHNVVNRSYLSHLLNIPLKCYRSIPQENCCVNLIRFANDESKLVTVNSVWHLL
jgi:broad specificity phosphatase PhoE